MLVSHMDYRRTFITAEDMVYAMTNSGEIIGVCQCRVQIGKGVLAESIISRAIRLAVSWVMKHIFHKTDLVVVTEAKTYFFKNIRYYKNESQYSFMSMYRIDNDEITRKKTISADAIRIGLPGSYSAKLFPTPLKKSPLFPDTSINVQQVSSLLFG
jgi:hypothetical protein